MIRYEIECQPGHIIDAPGIKKVAATRGRSVKALAIVFVDDADRGPFEKAVEDDPKVVGYRADPDGTATKEVTYRRK